MNMRKCIFNQVIIVYRESRAREARCPPEGQMPERERREAPSDGRGGVGCRLVVREGQQWPRSLLPVACRGRRTRENRDGSEYTE
jgi:hypothetical protein